MKVNESYPTQNKIEIFEYILFNFSLWYRDENSLTSDEDFNNNNDLSILKVIKLHYFLVSFNSKETNLLTFFDNFYAMPYGHVESDIYNNIHRLVHFKVDNTKTTIRLGVNRQSFTLSESIASEIDLAIENLRGRHPNLIKLDAKRLVDLSHKLLSWKTSYQSARASGRYSAKISSFLIRNDYTQLTHGLFTST